MDELEQQPSMDAQVEETTAPEASIDATADVEPQQPPAYAPSDFKYKYTGKVGDKWGDAEGELDEPIRALIKSKEDEEKWKKFYSKANGFDFIYEGREKARNEFKQYQEQAEPILKYAREASKYYNAGDLDSFFQVLGVPPDKIQQYVFNQLKQQELPAEQRQLIEQNRAYAKQIQAIQEQMQAYEQNNLTERSQMIYNELNTELSKPEIAQIKQAFDARNGAGAFENEIVQRGHTIYVSQNGRVARPAEIVQELITKYGLAPSQQASAPTSTQKPTVLATDKPTIPVVQGGGASPSHKSLKTLADLRKYKEELANNG